MHRFFLLSCAVFKIPAPWPHLRCTCIRDWLGGCRDEIIGRSLQEPFIGLSMPRGIRPLSLLCVPGWSRGFNVGGLKYVELWGCLEEVHGVLCKGLKHSLKRLLAKKMHFSLTTYKKAPILKNLVINPLRCSSPFQGTCLARRAFSDGTCVPATPAGW